MTQSLVVTAFKESDAPAVPVLVGAPAALCKAGEAKSHVGG